MAWTHGVATGRLDIHRFVETCSTAAAKIFGLFPRKGTIALGSDADLVVYDPDWEGAISAETHHMNMDYNPFEGWPVKGRCAAVTVRGQVQVVDGEFTGNKGIGRFIKREPQHF
jgi:dihydropyrimidinase